MYSINFTVAAGSDDATLSDLRLDDETIIGFAPETTSYSIELPFGTTDIPTVTATANDANAVTHTQLAPQSFFKIMRVVSDQVVGDFEDTRGGPVVLLQFDHM